MHLSPRYDSDPIIVIDRDPASIAAPAIAQRRRLLDAVTAFTPDQWSHASRCDGWTNRDVIVHLDGTNSYWTASIRSGLQGEPTRFLRSFDPVATPAELLAAAGDQPHAAVLESFRTSTEALVELWESLDASQWSAIAEAPPGHLRVSEVTHHALWDSWVHERDILEPLGLALHTDPAEVDSCLRYAVALGPALALSNGLDHPSSYTVRAEEPGPMLDVEVSDRVHVSDGTPGGDADLCGGSVELVEALSLRAPFPAALDAAVERMHAGLVAAFDADQRS